MQEFIVGNAGAFHKGRWFNSGQKIRIPDAELPSITWTWPNGAPVEIDVKKDAQGNVTKTLKPKGEPPAAPKPRTEDDEIAELEARLQQLRESQKAKDKPALSQVATPPKSPGTEDGNKKGTDAKDDKGTKGEDAKAAQPTKDTKATQPAKGGRPSDQDPA
jgi:hypothetical protein